MDRRAILGRLENLPDTTNVPAHVSFQRFAGLMRVYFNQREQGAQQPLEYKFRSYLSGPGVAEFKEGVLMDVCEAIRERRSVRSYSDQAVEREKIEAILEAARLSPSAGNRQKWKFIVVTDEVKRARLAGASFDQMFIAQAPVVLVACATESAVVMPCGQSAYTVDLSIAFAFMMLQAVELGLGTCWIGAFYEEEVKDILDIPAEIRVVALSPLGYPSHAVPARPRKSLDQIACFESYRPLLP